TKVLTGQRANWADIHNVAGIGIVESLARKKIDVATIAARKDTQLAGLGNFIEKPRTTCAQDAALLIQNHLWPQVHNFPLLNLLFDGKTAVVGTVVHIVILQLALTRLVANRTIDGMINQQKFQYGRLRSFDLRTGRLDAHALSDARITRDLQLGHLF